MGFLMARCAEGDQILGSIVAQSAPPPNVMDLKILRPPARLASPAVSLQNFTAEQPVGLRIKLQAGLLRMDPIQSVTFTSSTSCFLCVF